MCIPKKNTNISIPPLKWLSTLIAQSIVKRQTTSLGISIKVPATRRWIALNGHWWTRHRVIEMFLYSVSEDRSKVRGFERSSCRSEHQQLHCDHSSFSTTLRRATGDSKWSSRQVHWSASVRWIVSSIVLQRMVSVRSLPLVARSTRCSLSPVRTGRIPTASEVILSSVGERMSPIWWCSVTLEIRRWYCSFPRIPRTALFSICSSSFAIDSTPWSKWMSRHCRSIPIQRWSKHSMTTSLAFSSLSIRIWSV